MACAYRCTGTRTFHSCSHDLHRYFVSIASGWPSPAGIFLRLLKTYSVLPHAGQVRAGFCSMISSVFLGGILAMLDPPDDSTHEPTSSHGIEPGKLTEQPPRRLVVGTTCIILAVEKTEMVSLAVLPNRHQPFPATGWTADPLEARSR